MENLRSGIKEAVVDSSDHANREREFLKQLLLSALLDVSELLDLDLTRDIDVVKKRVEAEGFSFLSLTLPKYYKHVLRSVECRNFAPLTNFKRKLVRGRRTALPGFLQGLLADIFEDSGRYIYPVTDENKARQAEVLKIVEQICTGFAYKYEFAISSEQYNKQTDEAIELEAHIADGDFLDSAIREVPECKVHETTWDLTDKSNPVKLTKAVYGLNRPKNWSLVQKRATQLCHALMAGFDPSQGEFIPKHGPGAVFNRVDNPHEKYYFDNCSKALEYYFGYSEFYLANPGVRDVSAEVPGIYHYQVKFAGSDRRLPRVTRLGSEPYIPSLESVIASAVGGVSRAILVNKNADKGRGINMEDKERMWIQKGVQARLYEWLEAHPMLRVPAPYKYLLPFTGTPLRGASCINFYDQNPNGLLALTASGTQEYATLDMNQASTYVSTAHVDRLFPEKQRDILLALRSQFVLYQYKTNIKKRSKAECKSVVVKSRTYAPMGSAVCFPTEALVFYCYAKAALELEGCLSPVFVYGDDTLVPTRHAEKVIECFEHFGFKVNKNKSFIHGSFRESCGVNALNGVECTAPCRVKKRMYFRARKTDKIRNGLDRSEAAASFVAWVEYSNIFYRENYPRVASAIRSQLKRSYPKEFDHLVSKRRLTGKESYLCLLDYAAKPIKTQTRDETRSILVRFEDELRDLQQAGVTFSKSSILAYKRIYELGINNYQQVYVKGVSLDTERYSLPPCHPSFPDELAYLRWYSESPENSRSFSKRNRCRLKTSWQPL